LYLFLLDPEGTPTADNFELKEVELPALKDGELLIESLFLSVDPYQRGLLSKTGVDYHAGIPIGEPMIGSTIGRVAASNNDKFKVGSVVQGYWGWQSAVVHSGAGLQVKDESIPLSYYLGAAGATGLTAYGGLLFLDLKPPQKDETVFVSAASGAVGSIVAQICKLRGCRVIGAAGSDAKCAFLTEQLGLDAAINYKTTYVECLCYYIVCDADI
jgi:NADPH-dependent curcumin reductase CurA